METIGLHQLPDAAADALRAAPKTIAMITGIARGCDGRSHVRLRTLGLRRAQLVPIVACELLAYITPVGDGLNLIFDDGPDAVAARQAREQEVEAELAEAAGLSIDHRPG